MLIAHAADLDGGFELTVFVSMIRTIDRFTEEELASTGSNPEVLRAFFSALSDKLSAWN